MPMCIFLFPGKECPNLTIRYSNITNKAGEFETQVPSKCNQGYILRGTNSLKAEFVSVCNSSGLWSETGPCTSM